MTIWGGGGALDGPHRLSSFINMYEDGNSWSRVDFLFLFESSRNHVGHGVFQVIFAF